MGKKTHKDFYNITMVLRAYNKLPYTGYQYRYVTYVSKLNPSRTIHWSYKFDRDMISVVRDKNGPPIHCQY